jgi:hypothetical protein
MAYFKALSRHSSNETEKKPLSMMASACGNIRTRTSRIPTTTPLLSAVALCLLQNTVLRHMAWTFARFESEQSIYFSFY